MTILHLITPDLVWEYKVVRLRALQDSPTSFGSTWLRESQLTDEEWIARAENLIGERATGYLAFRDGRYVGLALCLPDEEEPRKGQLISMWVAPEARRQGVGKQLIDAIETWAAARGFSVLQLMVTSVNHSSSEFYKRLGFSLTGKVEPYPNDSAIEEYEMAKAL